jgi:hypothetical protein
MLLLQNAMHVIIGLQDFDHDCLSSIIVKVARRAAVAASADVHPPHVGDAAWLQALWIAQLSTTVQVLIELVCALLHLWA